MLYKGESDDCIEVYEANLYLTIKSRKRKQNHNERL
jgi:hypothetical protein